MLIELMLLGVGYFLGDHYAWKKVSYDGLHQNGVCKPSNVKCPRCDAYLPTIVFRAAGSATMCDECGLVYYKKNGKWQEFDENPSKEIHFEKAPIHFQHGSSNVYNIMEGNRRVGEFTFGDLCKQYGLLANLCYDEFLAKLMYIGLINVEREYRGRGLARKVIDKVSEEAREVGYAGIILEVSPLDAKEVPKDALVEIYSKLGLRELDMREHLSPAVIDLIGGEEVLGDRIFMINDFKSPNYFRGKEAYKTAMERRIEESKDIMFELDEKVRGLTSEPTFNYISLELKDYYKVSISYCCLWKGGIEKRLIYEGGKGSMRTFELYNELVRILFVTSEKLAEIEANAIEALKRRRANIPYDPDVIRCCTMYALQPRYEFEPWLYRSHVSHLTYMSEGSRFIDSYGIEHAYRELTRTFRFPLWEVY